MNEHSLQTKTTPELEKDLKKLSKKFRTLKDDIKNFIKTQLNLYHNLKVDNGGIFQIKDTGINYPQIFKAKKFACKSLKGKGAASGIRIIYAYYKKDNLIEFIEIYYKSYKENEDRERIKKYYKR
ncbi:MAG: hypothetical protein ABIH00_08795 [Armatimonadota bacterium]